jgi:glycosyltransferase involved in cell wall biosynthesis
MNVTILWTHWSGYMDACARALADDFGCSIRIVYFHEASSAPFRNDFFFKYAAAAKGWDPAADDFPEAEISEFPTDIFLIASWHIPAYRRLARKFRGHATRVLCMDNQWLATAKQIIGSLLSDWYIQPLYDFAFVPGARQADFACRLGFSERRIVAGHYSCCTDDFAAVYNERREKPLSRRFLFVGRLAPEKGIAVLKEAWQRYVATSNSPWTLELTGAGPLREQLQNIPFLSTHDFVQPRDLPRRMLKGDVFVLPSIYEPWGLVVHEASATGMPVVCSDACGSVDAFVRDGESGVICKAGDVDSLFDAFCQISSMPEARLRSFGEASYRLACERTPHTWAKAVVNMRVKVEPSLRWDESRSNDY